MVNSALIDSTWDQSIVPALIDYIRIPNKSPAYDPQWREHGHMARAVKLIADWCKSQPIAGLTVEVVELEGRTPIIFMEVPATSTKASSDAVLLYGHLDKQPEMVGWNEGLGPWIPVLDGDKLYGRGGADDGYAAFASLTAIRAAQAAGMPHARLVIVIEASEESGSPDLPYYIDALADRIGKPSLVVCLDSGCGNYDQLWSTTSLRGLVGGTLEIKVLTEGVHSGDASGVVPSSFRILRMLMSRVEDEKTGRILIDALQSPIPDQRVTQARAAAKVLGDDIWDKFPLEGSTKPMSSDLVELALNRTWRPTLSTTGIRGLPPIENAGNVLRPVTAVQLSFRLPPTCDHKKAYAAVKAELERDPPYGATVTFNGDSGPGWNAPALAPWLETSVAKASQEAFGRDAAYMGEGGSIPFMGMLGQRFPEAQFLITGVLGPASNAHGPNEFLHIPTGKKLTRCVARVLVDHCARTQG